LKNHVPLILALEPDVRQATILKRMIRDRVQDLLDQGRTLAQVKAMKPSATFEYEPRFNRDPAWTAEMFVETIYRNLSARK